MKEAEGGEGQEGAMPIRYSSPRTNRSNGGSVGVREAAWA